MNIKKYFGLFNIKNYILEVIETFNIDSKLLVTDEEKKEAATNLINIVSKLSGAVSLQPLPFADTLIITPVQVSLVMKIAQIYGKELDKRVVQEIVLTVIKAATAKTIAKTAVKYVPFVGAPICFAISYVTTNSIGLTAIRVFENKEDFNLEKVKESFEKEFNKSNPVNVVISNSIMPNQEEKPLLKRTKSTDLRAVHEETKRSIIYIPSEN